MNFIIKNGILVTAGSMYKADLEVRDGKITTIGKNLETAGKEVVDATGKYVLPGAIDMHTHMSDPFGGTVSSDSELTGSRAAACGGVTMMFDFATQEHGMHLVEALERKKRAYDGNACIDYSLHCIVTDLFWDDSVLQEFQDVVKYGVNTFKCYTVYREEGLMIDEEHMPKIMTAAADAGGMMTLHAENAGIIDYLIAKYKREGKMTPWYHYQSRPEYAAAQADIAAIHLAENLNVPIYIVHMDNKEGLLAAADAKRKGYPVFVETCPHYLEFNSEVYKREDAVKFVCSPPIKNEESRQALWRGIQNGDVDTIATDHCPFKIEEKNWGKNDFTKIPNGCGGIENRYPYMLSAASDGKISYCKAVEVCCENPAKIFGCTTKGSLEIGKDADIVIYDPQKVVIGGKETMHTACDHSIWDGFEYHGYPVQTYLRGHLIMNQGEYVGVPGEKKKKKRTSISYKKTQ